MVRAEAKKFVHQFTVDSLRRHAGQPRKFIHLPRGVEFSDSDYRKIGQEMQALADFLENRGKLKESTAPAEDRQEASDAQA